MRRLLALVVILSAPFPSLADEEWSVASAPPVVVRTTPEAGDNAVDPASKTIRVTFSKPMRDRSWSFVQASEATFPKIAGEIRYEPDGRTCVLPVSLEPNRTYVLWINSDRFQNFKDRDGRAAVPYLLVFATK